MLFLSATIIVLSPVDTDLSAWLSGLGPSLRTVSTMSLHMFGELTRLAALTLTMRKRSASSPLSASSLRA